MNIKHARDDKTHEFPRLTHVVVIIAFAALQSYQLGFVAVDKLAKGGQLNVGRDVVMRVAAVDEESATCEKYALV